MKRITDQLFADHPDLLDGLTADQYIDLSSVIGSSMQEGWDPDYETVRDMRDILLGALTIDDAIAHTRATV